MSFLDISYLELLVGAGSGIAGMYFICQVFKNAQIQHAEIVSKLINGISDRLDTQSEGLVTVSRRVDEVNNKIDKYILRDHGGA